MTEHSSSSEQKVKTANHVYILDEENSWVPAQVLERPSSTSAVVSVPQYANQQQIVCDGGRTARRFVKQNVDLTKYPNNALPLQNVDAEGRLQVVEDMVDLPFLHEVSTSLFGGLENDAVLCLLCLQFFFLFVNLLLAPFLFAFIFILILVFVFGMV